MVKRSGCVAGGSAAPGVCADRIGYDPAMLLSELAAASAKVGATRSRTAKVETMAACLRALADDDDPAALAAGVCFLAGRLRQGRLGVARAAVIRLRDEPAAPADSAAAPVDSSAPAAPAAGGPLTVSDVDRALGDFQRQRPRRAERLRPLFGRASAAEREYLVRLLIGEVRQGALDGLLVEAVAAAAGAPLDRVRRALMVSGDLPAVTRTALRGGDLQAFRLQVFRPVEPMLAQSAPTVAAALERIGAPEPAGAAAVEAKLDGMRVQIHREGDAVRVFTRTLRDVTAGLPAAVAAGRRLRARSAVVDGEALVMSAGGRPRPFQETMSAAGRDQGAPAGPVTVFLFDCLFLDGRDLTDRPWTERRQALAAICPAESLVNAVRTGDPEEAQRFVDRTLQAGHEGVVVKAAGGAYEAGRRGHAWVKVKPALTLDLVVLAAEWGSGRRAGSLSNLHLGARDPAGGFVMLGKTFKGMTDQVLRWQTERLQALATRRDGHVVHVRPELVAEIAFDGIQTSRRYPGGMALRFARLRRYRPDKDAGQADTVDAVRRLHRRATLPP